MRHPMIPLLPLIALLAGCAAAGGTTPPVSAGARPAGGFALPPATDAPASLAGRDAAALLRLFGTPRLDVSDGAARKLQFASGSCVLDIYLYPARPGTTPVAAHIDARSPDGRDVDADVCAAQLYQR